MKVNKVFLVLLVLLTISTITNAETVVRTRFSINPELDLCSIGLGIDQSLYKGFGLGFSFRKETMRMNSGYYISINAKYKKMVSDNRFIASEIGLEYGLAAPEFNCYITEYDKEGQLLKHRWIYLIQNAPIPGDKLKNGNTGIIYPFVNISGGQEIWKKLFFEAGIKVKIMKFGMKNCDFQPILAEIKEEEKWQSVYNIFVQLCYKF